MPVFQNLVEYNNSDTSESIAFSKIWQNSVEMKLSHARNRNNSETRNLAKLTELLAGFTDNSIKFSEIISYTVHTFMVSHRKS
jgi:hypothetical protein